MMFSTINFLELEDISFRSLEFSSGIFKPRLILTASVSTTRHC